MDSSEALFRPLAAGHCLGITSELLFQYTKSGVAKASRMRALSTVERSGAMLFSTTKLDTFDVLVAGAFQELWSGRCFPPCVMPTAGRKIRCA